MKGEDELRTAYWEDCRSDPRFPLWVIFRRVGQASAVQDGLPYVRPGGPDLPSVLKRLEQWPRLSELAQDLGLSPDDCRAVLWYLIWRLEHGGADPEWEDWQRWNARIDEAWRNPEP